MRLLEEIHSGGYVMWTLLFLSFVIWSFILSRFLDFKKGSPLDRKMRLYIELLTQEALPTAKEKIEEKLRVDFKMISSFIAVAPLLGLLGTVGGMIETFSSLESMELFNAGGGIAAGISQALLTTQLGLIVAVPAMLFLRFLEKRKKTFVADLDLKIRARREAYEI